MQSKDLDPNETGFILINIQSANRRYMFHGVERAQIIKVYNCKAQNFSSTDFIKILKNNNFFLNI